MYLQVSEVHKHQCVSLAVSEDGRYLLTAGQNSLKVWDYDMHLDVNAQVCLLECWIYDVRMMNEIKNVSVSPPGVHWSLRDHQAGEVHT